MAVNIVIADDHKMVREGLKCLLELDKTYNVVGEAGDGYECLDVVSKTNPDIIIMDINMPNLDGLQTLKIMRQENINKKVIMVTLYDDVDYLIKTSTNSCFLCAVFRVYRNIAKSKIVSRFNKITIFSFLRVSKGYNNKAKIT